MELFQSLKNRFKHLGYMFMISKNLDDNSYIFSTFICLKKRCDVKNIKSYNFKQSTNSVNTTPEIKKISCKDMRLLI